MSDWDDFEWDDLHADPGDDGIINNDAFGEFEAFLLAWILDQYDFQEDGFDDEPFDPWPGELSTLYPDLFAALDGTNLSYGEIGWNPERGFMSQDEAIAMGAEVRGTVFSDPADALRAIIDGGIAAFGFIVQFGPDEFGVGVDYPEPA